MPDKRKTSHLLSLRNVFLMHMTIYLLGLLMFWYSFVASLTYAGNTQVPRSVFAALGMERLSLSIFWGVILLIHLAVVIGHHAWKQRQIAIADSRIRWDDIATPARLSEHPIETTFDDWSAIADDHDQQAQR